MQRFNSVGIIKYTDMLIYHTDHVSEKLIVIFFYMISMIFEYHDEV